MLSTQIASLGYLKLLSSLGGEQFVLESISTPRFFKKNNLVFVKNEKFLTELLERAKNLNPQDRCAVIVGKISNLDLKNFPANWVVFSTENFEKSICDISKLFYDEKFSSVQSFVDGRIVGSAKIHPTAKIAQQAFIGEDVTIGENVVIYPGCVIQSRVSIGNGTVIYPNVSIYSFVEIGQNCRIHSSAVIGSDGFGYHFLQGEHTKIWHMGGVVIENNVEIGAGTCVDGGTFEPTKIGQGSKIDNQVQVAHNTIIGKNVVLCGQSGTAGSSSIGDYSVFGGRAALAPDCHLGKQVQVAGGGMVTKSWPDGTLLAGHPARELKLWLKTQSIINRLVKKEEK